MTNANVIEMNEVTKAFDRVTALNRCSLKVKRGEIFGYLGPSGAGKTTTLKLLTGQLHSDGGEMVVLGGEPLSPKMKQRIGIMSDMSGLYEKMTVYENLEIFADIYGVGGKRLDRVLRIWKFLRTFTVLRESGNGSMKFLRRNCGRLRRKSGKALPGDEAAAFFARTILHDPELLFLDEPTANLDPTTAQEVGI